ncbi:MAG: phosphatidylglycerol lysyltransferase domain-containing protein [Duncaniella sp.]|nr:phosphatidylglycerol lysyltransferase domain-containing protein [Duncaniella sp.]
MVTPRPNGRYMVSTITAPNKSPLTFKPLTLECIPYVRRILDNSTYRTCDFSIGGIYMWIEYFDYSYCIINDTLFIKGVTEDDVTRPAFSVPIGRMGLEESVDMLSEYCMLNDMELLFSAVPERAVDTLKSIGATRIESLDDWSDYLYSAEALATLGGKKLSKKRNHVNRFISDNQGYTFESLTRQNLPYVKEFFDHSHLPLSKPALADVEREQVKHVLDNWGVYPFEGAVLSTPNNGIVAFTIGEVINDTLHVHIEKMNHEIAGAGEAVNKLFAEMMTSCHPEIIYINRQEDVGDPGLRYAKESYHPLTMLRKFNVTF